MRDPASGRRSARLIRPAVVLAVVTLIGLAALIDATSTSRSTRTAWGPVDDAVPQRVAGTAMRLRTPAGAIVVTVGDPVTTIPASERFSARPLSAEPHEMFVPVDLSRTTGGLPVGLGFPPHDLDLDDVTDVTVRIEEEVFPLDGATVSSGPTYLRVPRATLGPSDVELVVDFGGVVQSVDGAGGRRTGPATPLYDLPATLDVQRCGDRWTASRPDVRVRMSCVAVAHNVPYLPGLGWAEERRTGATWAVVSVGTVLETIEVRGSGGRRMACLPSAPASGRLVLDGRPTDHDIRADEGARTPYGLTLRTVRAFLVGPEASRTLTVRRTQSCRTGRTESELAFTSRSEIVLDQVDGRRHRLSADPAGQPAATSATAAPQSRRPSPWVRCTCSRSTSAASSTVMAG